MTDRNMAVEANAALTLALGFRTAAWVEAMSVETTHEYGVLLWKMVRDGKMRSVAAPNWVSAGFQFYVWEHVTNEHEAIRAELMVLNAVFPPGVRFHYREGTIYVACDDWGEAHHPLPMMQQINQRITRDLQYLRQIRGLEPLPATTFLDRMRQEVDGIEKLPVLQATAADFANAAALLEEAAREVDS
jgi:hypothetical protein